MQLLYWSRISNDLRHLLPLLEGGCASKASQ